MVRVRLIGLDGATVEAEMVVAPGARLLESAQREGVPIPFGCQSARCGVCRVEVLRGRLAAAETPELLTLQGFDAPAEVRLACQARVAEDVDLRAVQDPLQPGGIHEKSGLE